MLTVLKSKSFKSKVLKSSLLHQQIKETPAINYSSAKRINYSRPSGLYISKIAQALDRVLSHIKRPLGYRQLLNIKPQKRWYASGYPSRTVKFSFFMKVPAIMLPERVPSGAPVYLRVLAGHFADVILW